jgi:hypothetical protein
MATKEHKGDDFSVLNYLRTYRRNEALAEPERITEFFRG